MLRFRLKSCFVNVATTCSVATASSRSQACPYPGDLSPDQGHAPLLSLPGKRFQLCITAKQARFRIQLSPGFLEYPKIMDFRVMCFKEGEKCSSMSISWSFLRHSTIDRIQMRWRETEAISVTANLITVFIYVNVNLKSTLPTPSSVWQTRGFSITI